MRILITIFYPLGKGGAEISTSLMCKELQKRGHEVIIASSGEYEGFRRYKIPNFRRYPVYMVYVYALAKALDRMIKKERVDVVYSQDINTTKGAILAAKKNGIPIAAHLRDYWFVCPKSSCMDKEYKSPQICSYSRLRSCVGAQRFLWDVQRLQMIRSCWEHFRNDVAVIFTLNNEMNRLLTSIGVPEQKALNVRGFRDLDALFKESQSPQKVSEFKRKLGLKSKVVTYVGSFSKIKGFFIVVEAIKKIVAQRKDVSFLFVGNGEGARELKGLSGVKHVPWISFSEMPLAYMASDLVLVPSLWLEPCSGVPIEASAFGVPIIAGNILDVKEGKYGVSISDILNAELWSAQINQLLDDPHLRKKLGDEAREYIFKNYNLLSYVDVIESNLKRIIEK